ncbi:glycerophosphodiester phosphodiesterase family protein [Sulfidibacter corallicola]|uniref:GP-PDE domain-containing protein n=1 Tax=Sulfidibacter corallicola TaxID=2818388 RepID=A0A8A4TLH9_SULCO|nr:hypothetical protein J3U87_32975 [Sulfidibacter corallicola]
MDIVEVGLKKTSDGHLVLMHDYQVNRTTDGERTVGSKTLAEVRALRLKEGLVVLPPALPTTACRPWKRRWRRCGVVRCCTRTSRGAIATRCTTCWWLTTWWITACSRATHRLARSRRS